MIPSKLDWAQHWAAQGFHVFPLHPNTKRPVHKDWPTLATSDPAPIEAWWAECPDYNIGCSPGLSGHSVLDIDTKGGDGFATLEELIGELGDLPPTLTCATPSGGKHIWLGLEGSCKNSVGSLGPHIDTRGNRGFVVMPGSELDGVGYEIDVDAAVAPAPTAWADSLRALGAKDENRETRSDAEDTTEDIARAEHKLRALIAQNDVAIEGQGGNDRTYRLFTDLRDLGISIDMALVLIEPWNKACLPPWDDHELEQIAKNAYNYAQNEAGAKAGADGECFAALVAPDAPIAQPSEKPNRFTPMRIEFFPSITEPPWLIPGWLPSLGVSMLYGDPGSKKSFAAIDAAMSIASGRMPWGIEGERTPLPVAYIAGEGQTGIAKKRVPAWQEFHTVGDDPAFYLIKDVPLARNKEADVPALFDAIESGMAGELPRLVVLYTDRDWETLAMRGHAS